jgi:hypothetical protein
MTEKAQTKHPESNFEKLLIFIKEPFIRGDLFY